MFITGKNPRYLIMKIYSYLLFPTVLASLAFTTSVKAEEVSAKAGDLIGSSPNLLAQSSDPGVTPTSPTTTPSTPVYTGGDVNPDLPASNYRYGSFSVGFGSQSDVDGNALGVNLGSISFNSTFSSNSAFGYQFEQARVELEFSSQFLSPKEFTRNRQNSPISVVGNNARAHTMLLNGYYDIPTGSKLRPYVGGGLGLAWIDGNLTSSRPIASFTVIDGTSFAYQLKGGVQYEVTKKGNVFGELKYFSISSYTARQGNNTNIDISSSNSFGFAVGYRQGF